MSEPRIILKSVTRSFGSGQDVIHILNGIDLTVYPGEVVVLYGPSGSGKTTLLNLIGALDHPTSGDIQVDGRDILLMTENQRADFRRKTVGFIFQNYTLLPTYSALENIDLVLRLPGLGYLERRRRATEALKLMGLSAWANHVPDELSGGQRQRIAIARALALRPAVILADEPTSGLDTRMARRVMSLFRQLAQEQSVTFLIVSHDPMIADYAGSVYELDAGHINLRSAIAEGG